ncbi:hypothetical protein E1B28_003721 [Marasmius oreades]|uniref:Uncharacterized protein n=1 Tax=Marasmius oreades TaxID=181124 RepID=A0A9P7UX89_9AGAR|nr:uncharacterized protein E1B28_003721 [Marasmius oreades]KAG7096273.1 hypothetical protein E1B28_003721 [Marasmius oreades]
MTRFNLALVYIFLAAWSVNVSQSVPLPRASTDTGTVIPLSQASNGTSGNHGNTTTTTTTGNTNSTAIKTDSLQCNIARAVIITDLGETNALLQQIDTSNSQTLATAVSRAREGVQTAGEGIKGILTALISGTTPPADGRKVVDQGLGTTLQALTGLNSTDTGVTNALNKLKDAIAAGDEVVATCR